MAAHRIALIVALGALCWIRPLAAQSGFSDHDASQPIEITSDSLVVEQEQQIAIFSGNVDAVQGPLVLRADRLDVHYSERSDESSDAGIRLIEADGNVFISSPPDTAEADHGTYAVGDGLITLTGSVVLTRKDNVIRGQKLEINLVSGRSEVIGGGSETAAVPGQRVRALFVPDKKKDD